MRIIDFVFAVATGFIVGFVTADFLREWGIRLNFYYLLLLLAVFGLISLFCLWLTSLMGKKLLFVFQAAKHLLIGALVTVIDLKIFELLIWTFLFFTPINYLIPKGVSFIVSTLLKFLGNKYWAFEKNDRENINKEIFQFFLITLIGLAIDIISFYYFINILQPQFGMTLSVWIKLSVVFAALAAALWNFLGYKFLVFKK